MQRPYKIGLIGCGLRGIWYLHSFKSAKRPFELVAAADPDLHYANLTSKLFGNSRAQVFRTGEEMIDSAPELDGVVIASPNYVHREPTVRAMDRGLHMLLEKPVASRVEDMAAMWQAQLRTQQRPIIGFCLRYTPFYRKIHEIIAAGALGKVLVVNAEELMSDDLSLVFARGNWRPNHSMSGGLMAEKCSHDMDILNWFTGGQAKLVHSFAKRTFLTPLDGAGKRCRECDVASSCRFKHGSVPEIFEAHWPVELHEVLARLHEDDACVFGPQHTYPDHQVLNIQYSNGVLCNFTVAQCQTATRRTVHVLGSEARLYGVVNDNEFKLFRRSKLGEETCEIIKVNPDASGHNGGDSVLADDFFASMEGSHNAIRPGLKEGIEASLLSFAADQSAAEGMPVQMDALRDRVFRTANSAPLAASTR